MTLKAERYLIVAIFLINGTQLILKYNPSFLVLSKVIDNNRPQRFISKLLLACEGLGIYSKSRLLVQCARSYRQYWHIRISNYMQCELFKYQQGQAKSVK